jgi:hypothetical protein
MEKISLLSPEEKAAVLADLDPDVLYSIITNQ